MFNAVDFKGKFSAAFQEFLCFLFELLNVGVDFFVVQHVRIFVILFIKLDFLDLFLIN